MVLSACSMQNHPRFCMWQNCNNYAENIKHHHLKFSHPGYVYPHYKKLSKVTILETTHCILISSTLYVPYVVLKHRNEGQSRTWCGFKSPQCWLSSEMYNTAMSWHTNFVNSLYQGHKSNSYRESSGHPHVFISKTMQQTLMKFAIVM